MEYALNLSYREAAASREGYVTPVICAGAVMEEHKSRHHRSS